MSEDDSTSNDSIHDALRTDDLKSDSDPFSELDVGDDGDESIDEVFDQVEVDELSDEELWAALEEESTVGGGPDSVEPGPDAAREVDTDHDDHIVDKREYCQRCPYFADPPDTACTHEAGRIVEVVDTDEFRVRGCPMVSETGPQFDTGP